MRREAIRYLIAEADELINTYSKTISTESLFPIFIRMLVALKRLEYSDTDGL